MKSYVGLDVHSKTIFFVAMNQCGKVIAEGNVPTSFDGLQQMQRALPRSRGITAALESGAQAFWVARLLFGMGIEPVIVSAQEVRARASRRNQKCDSRDAFELCDGIRRGLYQSLVFVPPPELERLRRVLSRRQHFVKVCAMQVNAAKFVLRSNGVRFQGCLVTRAAWERLLSDPRVEEVREFIEPHFALWRLAREQVEKLNQLLEEAGSSYQRETALLQTCPGVGKVTAAAFVAAVGDPRRFAHAGKLASYIGIVPSSYDSGERTRHGHITRAGSPSLRALLCEAAHHAGRPNHPLNPYWRRMMVLHGYRKAVVAVAHRLARILFQMWRRNEAFDEGKLNVVRRTQNKKRSFVYRLKEVA